MLVYNVRYVLAGDSQGLKAGQDEKYQLAVHGLPGESGGDGHGEEVEVPGMGHVERMDDSRPP